MKKVLSAVGLFVLSLGLVAALSASTCVQTSDFASKDTALSAKGRCKFVVDPDSLVISRMGEKASIALFASSKGTLYKINPSVRPLDNDMTIGGFKVEEKLNSISKQELYFFQFLLADSLSYSNEPIVPLTPFAPTAAIEFSGKQGTVFLLFSTTSQEVGVVVGGKRVFTSRYCYARLITRWFAGQLNDDFYKELLNQ